MKRNVVGALLGTLMIVGLALSSCTLAIDAGDRLIGSGRPATRDYSLSGFTAVEVDTAIRATITQGSSYSVSVTADDNALDNVRVTKDGDTLRIRYENGRVRSFSLRTPTEARITMPELRGVRLNGASRASVSGFKSEGRFEAYLDGASQMNGNFSAGDTSLSTNGASRYTLNGSASSLTLRLDGASRADLSDLGTDRASVRMNGASQATVSAHENLDYVLNGASHLGYSGNPAIGQARSEGASSARRQ